MNLFHSKIYTANLSPTVKVHVAVVTLEDRSMPVPFEEEQWVARPATRTEIVEGLISAVNQAVKGEIG
jgi:hypothetical protein